jgi:hypothetical protein
VAESPKAYREKNPYNPPPKEYKPPSMLRQHWGLAVLFVCLSVAFAVYCLKPSHRPSAADVPRPPTQSHPPAESHPPAQSSPPAQSGPPSQSAQQPVYIDAIPEKDPSPGPQSR